MATSAGATGTNDTPPLWRRGLIPALKVSIGVFLIVYALRTDKFHFHEVAKSLTPGVLAMAVSMFSIQLFLGAQRLRLLLWPLGTEMSYLTSLRLTYLGAFFDVFMVTSVGGDAIKAIYVARQAPHGRRTASVSVLVLDRLMGLLGLLMLTLLVSSWQLKSLWSDEKIRPSLIGLVCVSAFLLTGTALLFSKTFYHSRLVQTVLKRMPLGSTIDTAFVALQSFRGRPALLAYCGALSLTVHTAGVLTGYILSTALSPKPLPLGRFFVALMISNFCSSFLPAGGIGGGQIAFGAFFERIAGSKIGAALATASQLTFLLAKAPGLPAWLISREVAPAVVAPATNIVEEKNTHA